MKTFETEKNNIPEGATHTYDLATSKTGYYKLSNGNWYFFSHDNGSWCQVLDDKPYYDAVPIPQTKEVEWENGQECRYANDIDHEYIYIGEHPHGDGHYVFSEEKGITYIANGYLLEPETPEAKKEREELESAYDLYCELNANHNCVEFDRFKKNCGNWIRVVRKTGYRVGK